LQIILELTFIFIKIVIQATIAIDYATTKVNPPLQMQNVRQKVSDAIGATGACSRDGT